LELHFSIPENSPEAILVHKVATEQRVSPHVAAQQLLTEAVRAHMESEKSPGERLMGAFSSDEDARIMDEAMEVVRVHRAEFDRVRDFGD